MKCPYCGNTEDRVLDSRSSQDDESIRRRRECLKCLHRYTTYEYLEKASLMVVKKDGRRVPFDRNKILNGIMKACEKRPIAMEKVESVVDDIERTLIKTYEREVASKEIGELVMKKLHDLDQVAYVRFASVYRQFKDISEFMSELKELLG